MHKDDFINHEVLEMLYDTYDIQAKGIILILNAIVRKKHFSLDDYIKPLLAIDNVHHLDINLIKIWIISFKKDILPDKFRVNVFNQILRKLNHYIYTNNEDYENLIDNFIDFTILYYNKHPVDEALGFFTNDFWNQILNYIIVLEKRSHFDDWQILCNILYLLLEHTKRNPIDFKLCGKIIKHVSALLRENHFEVLSKGVVDKRRQKPLSDIQKSNKNSTSENFCSVDLCVQQLLTIITNILMMLMISAKKFDPNKNPEKSVLYNNNKELVMEFCMESNLMINLQTIYNYGNIDYQFNVCKILYILSLNPECSAILFQPMTKLLTQIFSDMLQYYCCNKTFNSNSISTNDNVENHMTNNEKNHLAYLYGKICPNIFINCMSGPQNGHIIISSIMSSKFTEDFFHTNKSFDNMSWLKGNDLTRLDAYFYVLFEMLQKRNFNNANNTNGTIISLNSLNFYKFLWVLITAHPKTFWDKYMAHFDLIAKHFNDLNQSIFDDNTNKNSEKTDNILCEKFYYLIGTMYQIILNAILPSCDSEVDTKKVDDRNQNGVIWADIINGFVKSSLATYFARLFTHLTNNFSSPSPPNTEGKTKNLAFRLIILQSLHLLNGILMSQSLKKNNNNFLTQLSSAIIKVNQSVENAFDFMLTALTDIMKAEQENDEMVCQIVYSFYLMLQIQIENVLNHDSVIPILIDLMHDRNPMIKQLSHACLNIVGLKDKKRWGPLITREMFVKHNAYWLEMIETLKDSSF